jgi:acyl transferase domain-containing protein
MTLEPPQIPFISNVTAAWISNEEATDPAYWAGHIRQAVRFADGLQALLQEPARVLLEVDRATPSRAWPSGIPPSSPRPW